jgi:DNA-binding protein YbaB
VVSSDYDGGLGQAVEEMGRLAQATEGGEPPEGQGVAADGLLQVTAAGGRIRSVEINPRAMRMASQDLAEAITEAVNAALADMESKYPELPIASIDPARLRDQLAQAHEEGIRAMRRYTDSITDALSRFNR